MSITLSKHHKKHILSLGLIPTPLRHRLMRRMIRLPGVPEGITYEIARTREDLDAAFSLVYQAYRREGITRPVPSQQRVTLFHALPSTTTLVAKKGDTVVATVSVVRDGCFGLPSDDLANLNLHRIPGKRLAEVSSLALRPDLHGQAAGVMFYLSKYMILYSRDYFGVDGFIIAVHPRRLGLYQGIFLFSPLAGGRVKSHSFANNAPAVVAVRDFDTAEADFRNAYQNVPPLRNLYQFVFDPMGPEETRAMKFPPRPFAVISDPVMSPDLMHRYFRENTDLFSRTDPCRMAQLRHVYPSSGFSRVLGNAKGSPSRNRQSHMRFDTKCHGMVCPGATPAARVVTVMEVSESAMQVLARPGLPADRDLTFFIVTQNRQTARVTGRTIWSEGPVHGICLTRTDAAWQAYVRFQKDCRLFSHQAYPHTAGKAAL